MFCLIVSRVVSSWRPEVTCKAPHFQYIKGMATCFSRKTLGTWYCLNAWVRLTLMSTHLQESWPVFLSLQSSTVTHTSFLPWQYCPCIVPGEWKSVHISCLGPCCPGGWNTERRGRWNEATAFLHICAWRMQSLQPRGTWKEEERLEDLARNKPHSRNRARWIGKNAVRGGGINYWPTVRPRRVQQLQWDYSISGSRLDTGLSWKTTVTSAV